MHDHLAMSALCGAMASALAVAGPGLARRDSTDSSLLLHPMAIQGPRSFHNRVHGLLALAIGSGPTVSDLAAPCRIRPEAERGSPVMTRLVGSR